jgi:predicted porin
LGILTLPAIFPGCKKTFIKPACNGISVLRKQSVPLFIHTETFKMTKKILALALASAFAAPAFAATSNVEIYGLFRGSVDFVNDDFTTGGDSTVRVSSNSSRLGFKGAEDLGGGLALIWQVESAINLDGGGTTLGTRNTFVGLKSKTMGQVILGNNDTPYKTATGKLDVFGDTIADYQTIIGQLPSAGNLFDVRAPNIIRYDSPSFSGFTFSAAYVAQNEGGSTTSDAATYSLSGVYSNGPLFASLAYEMRQDVLSGGVLHDPSAFKLGLGYSFGGLSVGGVYENADGDGILAQDRDAYYLSAAYKMGNITLKGAYGAASDSDAAVDDSADFYALGMDYALSKRTSLFAIYTSLDNDTTGAYDLGSGVSTAVNTSPSGDSPSAFSVGVSHTF